MLVLNGKKVAVEGVPSTCFLDNPKQGFTDPKDYGERKGQVKSICLHTRMGIWPQVILEEGKDRRWDEVSAARASRDSRRASWHISIDADGSFVCHLDLVVTKAYHAGQANDSSVGIEMYQTSKGEITQATLDTCVKICDVLTRELGIQRMVPSDTKILTRFASPTGRWHRKRKLAYMPGGKAGTDYYGVFGHRNVTRNRGQGDPGDEIFKLLENNGYEKFDIEKGQDISIWKDRQAISCDLPAGHCDGVPGPFTRAHLLDKGYLHGLWVSRPGD